MRNFYALCFTLLCSFSLFAQRSSGGFQRGGQQPSGRFYGKVVDLAGKGIEAASVTLVASRMDSVSKQAKEVVVGGMLTGASGDFAVENVPVFGRYKLRITGIGYKTFEQAVAFSMPNTNGGADPSAMLGALDKDLGNLKLEVNAQVLGTVTVTATKPLLQLGIDRKIFNVDKNIVSAGGTAVDIMRNVPSLNVDIDGNITLRNSAPQIFVDGRPTTLTLEQIPSDAIESVEIITNPSAKFDASGGTAGILNIVLKKNRRVGYSGNTRINVDSRGRVGGGADINIRQNKINVFASGNYNQRKSIGEGNTDRITFGRTVTKTFQNDENTMTGAFGFGRFGLDYFIDNRNTLTASQTFARGAMKPRSTSSIFSNSGRFDFYDSLLDRMSNSKNEFRNMGTQLSFKHNFPRSGQEFTADVTYNRGKNENDNFIGTNYYSLPQRNFIRSYNQQQVGSGDNDNLIVQADYVNPLTDRSKLEFGVRTSVRNLESSTEYFIINPNGSKTPINSQNILFKSRDQVYAAYGNYSNKIKDFGYQLGLRAESSDYEGQLLSKGQNFNIKYPISLFPSVFLSQKLTETQDLQLNYSRRINRPNFWQLFPFVDISDSLNISRGNPALRPEFTNSIEVAYSKTFENRDNLIASVYFKNSNNLITRVQQPEYIAAYNDTLLVNTYVNANSSYVTGLELTSKNKLTKWWELTSNANFFTSKINLNKTVFAQEDPDQFFSYFVKVNNSFRLPKNFSFQLSADYQSKIISSPGGGGGGFGRGGFGGGGMFGGGGGSSAAQGYIRPNFGVDAAVRFEFLKENRASISLNVNDVFRTRKYNAHSESPYFIQDSWRRRDWQVARLNFNYRFGKFDANLFKRKSNKGEGNIDNGGGNF